MATKAAEIKAAAPDQIEGFYDGPLPGGPEPDRPDDEREAAEGQVGTVLVDGERYSVVQGDLLVDDDELDLYRQQQAEAQRRGSPRRRALASLRSTPKPLARAPWSASCRTAGSSAGHPARF